MHVCYTYGNIAATAMIYFQLKYYGLFHTNHNVKSVSAISYKQVINFSYFVLHQRAPLHLAAEKGRFENILGYLIDQGAGINIKDNEGVKIHVAMN